MYVRAAMPDLKLFSLEMENVGFSLFGAHES